MVVLTHQSISLLHQYVTGLGLRYVRVATAKTLGKTAKVGGLVARATEVGILHRLRKEAPDKQFEALSEEAVCGFMKMITLEKVRDSLRDMQYPVTVAPEIAARARRAVERMIALG